VLRDQRAHGYPTASAGLARLHRAIDAPGSTAPLEVRWRYQLALLRVAMEGGERTQIRTSLGALQQMADDEHCVACQFYALLAQARLTMNETSPRAARRYLEQAQALLPKVRDKEAHERLLALRGNIDGQDGQWNLGVEYTMQALELAEADDDDAEAVRLLGKLVWMNDDLGDIKRAASLGEESYARAAAMGYLPMVARISLDLGHAYSLAGDRRRQRVAIERALAFSRTDPSLLGIEILSLNNLSDYYLSQPGQIQRVLDYATQAEALARSHGIEIDRAAPLTNMGIALARMGKVDAGIADIRQAVAISKKADMKEYIVGITMELVKVLEHAGRYREALAQLQQADAVQENLTRQQRTKAVLELQEKYAAERKSQQIAQLSAQNKLKQAELAAQSWRSRLWIALAAALALGSVLLIQSIRRTRHVNRQLAVANASLAEQSMVDPLTGAFNRRHTQVLLERLQQALPRRRTHDTDATTDTGLLILDLDFFKRVNDTWGHAAGDAVLVAVAQRLRGLLRREDVVARWGGEEFVLVLPRTPADAMLTIASNVLHAIGDTPVVFQGQPMTITASIGALSYPAIAGQDWEAALGLADLALYQAKAGGRNRAFCLTRVAPGTDAGSLARDLAQASEDGDIDLDVVFGPPQDRLPLHRGSACAEAVR
jgi:diguanylate cyclase (GGDEF)-like protein